MITAIICVVITLSNGIESFDRYRHEVQDPTDIETMRQECSKLGAKWIEFERDGIAPRADKEVCHD